MTAKRQATWLRPMATPYAEARERAQKLANETGFDHGLERGFNDWHVFMLPAYDNRYGHETSCEVVSPEDLSKCRPGHGPARKHLEESLSRRV